MLADVASIELTSARSAPAGSTHVVHRRGRKTCRVSALAGAGLHYEVLGHCGKQVYLKPRMPDGDFAAMPESIADTMAQTMAAAASFREGLVELPAAPVPAPVIHVKPAAAAAHERLFVGHSTHPRDYIPEPTYLLDVPILRQLDVRPYRCQDCKREQRGIKHIRCSI